MRVVIKSGNVEITADGEKQTDVFESLAKLQETFTGEGCGKCGKTDTKYVVREDKEENKYYELRCLSCHAKLTFGQIKGNGELFPIRHMREGKLYLKDENDKLIKKGVEGWVKWNFEKKCEE